MREKRIIGENTRKISPPEVQLPKEGVVVGVIGGVFMSSVPQTPEYQAMQKEAEAKIRQRRS